MLRQEHLLLPSNAFRQRAGPRVWRWGLECHSHCLGAPPAPTPTCMLTAVMELALHTPGFTLPPEQLGYSAKARGQGGPRGCRSSCCTCSRHERSVGRRAAAPLEPCFMGVSLGPPLRQGKGGLRHGPGQTRGRVPGCGPLPAPPLSFFLHLPRLLQGERRSGKYSGGCGHLMGGKGLHRMGG